MQKVQLLSMSMRNILSVARIENGAPPGEVPFVRCEDQDAYTAPWQRSTGVTQFGFYLAGPGEEVLDIQAEQLLEQLREASGLEAST